MRYAPFSFVVTECTVPVCGLFTVILAPETGAPDPSTTVPVTVAFCAQAALTVIRNAAIPHVANLRNFFMNPPSNPDSLLSSKDIHDRLMQLSSHSWTHDVRLFCKNAALKTHHLSCFD